MQVLKEEIRIKILEAAKDLFLQHGFDNASMNMIAKRAGISKSNLYNYFEGKEEIFFHLTDKAYMVIQSLLDNLLHHEAVIDIKDFLAQVSKEVIKLLIEYREEILLIMDSSKGTRYEDAKHEFIIRLQEHFIEEFKEHRVPIDDDDFISHYMSTSLIEGLLETIRHDKSDKWISENIKTLLEFHVSGYSRFFPDYTS